VLDFFRLLFDGQGFPPRWSCGEWSAAHGWLHVVSDLGVFTAYLAIPITLAYLLTRRRDLPFPRVLWLFVAFIVTCGLTHLNEAVIFWHPYYRFAGVVKLATAVVSWATVFALVPTVRAALTLRTPTELEAEVAARTRELEEARQELERSNADLEHFAYTASHDLREPLRMVASYTTLLEEEHGARLDDEAKEYIHYAVDGAERMRRLLDDLLEYSRVQSRGGHMVAASTAAVLDDVLQDLKVALDEAEGRVTRGELPEVLADPSQLRQLFQNLLANAIKFRGDAPGRVHVSAEREGDRWRFAVRDEGIGLDPSQAERIFKIFKRLHPRGQYEGTGLGLAICKRIVERHGGEIGVESQPGEGATFWFTLPAAA